MALLCQGQRSNHTGALHTSLNCLSYRDMQEQYNAMEMANRVLRCIRSSWCIAESWWVRCTAALCRVSTSWPQFVLRGTWQLKGHHRRACKRELKSSQSDSRFFFSVFIFSATLGTRTYPVPAFYNTDPLNGWVVLANVCTPTPHTCFS